MKNIFAAMLIVLTLLLSSALLFSITNSKHYEFAATLVMLETFLTFWLIFMLKRFNRMRIDAEKREKKFKTFFEITPYSCVVTDSEHRYTMVNKAFCTTTGYSEADIIGKTNQELGLNQDRKDVDLFTKELEEKGVILNKETTFLHKDNEFHFVMFSAASATIENQLYTISSAVDITDLEKSRQLILESEKRAKKQRAALAEIALHSNVLAENQIEIINKITKIIAETLNVERGSIWTLSEDNKLLTSISVYELSKTRHSSGQIVETAQFPNYFDSLQRERRIYTSDAQEDPRTFEIKDNYLIPLGIASLIDAIIISDGTISGIVSAEHIGETREWFPDEELFVTTVAAIVSQIFANEKKRKAEEALLKNEMRLSYALSATSDAVWEWDYQTGKTYYSSRWYKMLGYENNEFEMTFDTWKNLCHPDDFSSTVKKIESVIKNQQNSGYQAEFRMKHKNGDWIWILGRGNVVKRNDSGEALLLSGTNTDISAWKKSEENTKKLQDQLNQAQKMDSIGRLASGVAHDFNNMLGVITGYSEMALLKTEPSDIRHSYLDEIKKAALRSANIAKQLLAFARQQSVEPKIVNINEVVESMAKMLRRLIGEDLAFRFIPEKELWNIKIDPSQIDQVLANLCVNARDAISGTGTISIETKNAFFDAEFCKRNNLGDECNFVMLAVTDTGCGMDAETQSKIFEPFFTTKSAGKGTGLGLATVYGIVKQNGGFVNVSSEIGKGTVFKLYFPKQIKKMGGAQLKEESASAVDLLGKTVLLVEDEPALLKLINHMLEDFGCRVIFASRPREAVKLALDYPGKIDLLLTDVIMPELNGKELSAELLLKHSSMRILFMSGYTPNSIWERGIIDEGVNFIQKPFSTQDINKKLKEIFSSPI